MPILAALAFVFALAFAYRAGQNAGQALWLPVVLMVLAVGALGLYLWHRRALDHIRHLHLEHLSDGRWTQVSKFQVWPKRCIDCAFRVHTWREASAHDDAYTSPCAAMRERRLELEAAQAAGIEAPEPAPEAILEPGRPPGSDWKVSVVDTGDTSESGQEALTESPTEAIEAPVE